MSKNSSVSRSLKSQLQWLFVFFVAFGYRGVAGNLSDMLSNLEELSNHMGDSLSDIRRRVPSMFGSFGEEQKVTIKQEGKCSFLLEWRKGVKCSDFRAFVDPQNRTVNLLYSHEEVDSASSSSEFMEKSLSLDDDCLVNEWVVKKQLGGFMKNDPADCSKHGQRVRIVFPSKEWALKLEKSAELPEGIVKALEEGDTDVVNKLTDDQACALIREWRDCANLKRGAKGVQAAEEKYEEAPAEGDEKQLPSEKAEEEAREESRSRIPLPNIGSIDDEL